MAFYRITIVQKNPRRRASGIREYAGPYPVVLRQARQQAEAALGKDTIEDIQVTKLPADSPAVLAYLKANGQPGRQP